MAVPNLNWLNLSWFHLETLPPNNTILVLGFDMPDSTAANQAAVTCLQNLQAEVDQQINLINFGGGSVLAVLQKMEITQLPGQRPQIKLWLEHTSDWSEVPTQ